MLPCPAAHAITHNDALPWAAMASIDTTERRPSPAESPAFVVFVLDKTGNPVRVRPNASLENIGDRCPRMKNVYEVLRQKELELARLEKEVEALRVAAPLLSDDNKESMVEATSNKPTLASSTQAQQPIRIPQAAVNASPQPARAAGWEDTAKRWP